MNLKRLVMNVAAAASIASLVACGGGGGVGSVSTGGVYYTHAQLADEFVRRAYSDVGIDVTLVKTNTAQSGYVVVYDQYYGTYDAYYIDGWSVGTDLNAYLNNTSIYTGLDYLGGNQYQDYASGVIFEETSASSKDLEKVAAVKEEMGVKSSADKIMSQFGLTEERSLQVARLAVQLKNTPAASMTSADYNNFSKELFGTSIDKVTAALKKKANGDASDMNKVIETAAATNGVGPEHMQEIADTLFPTKN